MKRKIPNLMSMFAIIALIWSLSSNAQTSVYLNFEDTSKLSNWVLEANVATDSITAPMSPIVARSGSKVFKISGFDKNTGYHYRNTVDSIVVKPGDYIHTIVYGGCSLSGGLAAPSYSSSMNKPTPGFSFTLSTTDVSTQIFDGGVRQNTTGSDLSVFPRFRTKPGNVGNEIYYDDFVLYTDTNSQNDFVSPEPATNFMVDNITSNSLKFSWTEGMDTLSGVNMTYILRTQNTSAEAPVLMPQVGYSVVGGALGDNAIGDWMVIAMVDAGTTSYTDMDVTEGQTYMYAVVHKDLAYNNSVALKSGSITIEGGAAIQKSLYLNFEEDTAASQWVLENASDNVNISIVTPSIPARSGSKVIQFDGFNRSTGFHIKDTVNHITMKPGEYIHGMVHGGTSVTGPQAAGTFSSAWARPTPGSWITLSDVDVTAQIIDASVRQYPDTETNDMDVYPRFRIHPRTEFATVMVYFDDFVLYADTNPTFDFVAPEAASNFSFVSQTATANQFSWTEGMDTLTGVQMTYVLRASSPIANPVVPQAPELLAQKGYSVAGGSAGDNTVGDWTVIAELSAGTTSYTDNSVADGVAYTYAIVHRDLAYNNSVALLSSAEPDVTAPVLSNVSSSVEKGDNISATSDKDGMIYLVPNATYVDLAAVVAAKVAEVSVTKNEAASIPTASLPLGDYLVYAVSQADVLSDPSAMVTLKDETAPSVPTLSVYPDSITGTSLVVSFASTDNDTVKAYKVYLGDEMLATVVATGSDMYKYVGLQFGTEYSLNVSAVDNTGNESAKGSTMATTLSPVISAIELINATTDQKLADITDGLEIYVTSTSNNLNIRAVTNPEPLFDGLKVKMDVSGKITLSKTEGVAPYALWGDASGDYNNNALDTGMYTLRAVIIDGSTEIGDPFVVNFTVKDTTSTDVAVKALSAINAIVYPVPVSNTLYVSGMDNAGAKVYSISGKLLMEFRDINRGIEVTSLTSGLYILKLTDKNGNVSSASFTKQ